MDFTKFVPREMHNGLAWLGRFPSWLETTSQADGSIHFSLNIPTRDNRISEKDYHATVDFLNATFSEKLRGDYIYMLYYRAAAAALANGSKMFQPTPMQCEAMENVDIEVPFSEYRQPYETLIIQLPTEYCRSAMERYKLDKFPSYAIIHHDLKGNVITAGAIYDVAECTVSALAQRSPEETLEQGFGKKELEGVPAIDKIIQRLGVNICLLMTQYRTRVSPMDANYRSKLEGLARKKNRDKAERAKTLLVGQMNIVQFEQNVQFYDIIEEPADRLDNFSGATISEGEPAHRKFTTRPHWRRGHWRRVRFGTGHALVRRQYIRPVLVNKRYFVGDKSQTSVVYAAKQHHVPNEEGYGG